jgi:hypothetical protein
VANSLRRAVDVAGVLAGIGAAVVIGLYSYRHIERQHRIDTTITALREFDRAVAINAAGRDAQLTANGWPVSVDPAWFEGQAPRNLLLSADRPWLEVASEDEAALLNPPLRIAAQGEIAAFWYNPYRGVVRARVPLLISEQDTINLYNRINHTTISACVEPFTPARKPAQQPAPQENDGDGAAGTRVSDVPTER